MIAEMLEAPNELLDAALFYASKGWPVFPLHAPDASGKCDCRDPNCISPAKHPRVSGGFKQATTNPDQIRKWWSMWPRSNVGIRTGNTLVTIDVDAKKGGLQNWETLCEQHEKLPDTPQSFTGSGGKHLLFQGPADLDSSVSRIAPGIDVRADGGYIVAPPSLHILNHPYQWEFSSHPQDVGLAPIPDWLLTLATKKPDAVNPRGATTLPDVFMDGQRNDCIFRFASSMRAKGMDFEEIFPAAIAVNSRRCAPPLSEIEVEKTVMGVVKRYPIGNSKERQPVTHDRHDPANAGSSGGSDTPSVGDGLFDRGDAVELAQHLLLDLRADSPVPVVHDRGAFWRYDEAKGIYVELSSAAVKRAAESFAGRGVRTPRGSRTLRMSFSDVTGCINAAIPMAADEDGFFNSAPSGIAFRNGFVVVKNGRVLLSGHGPEHRATSAMPFDFNPGAPSPRWTQYLEEVFANASEQDRADRIALAQEFSGACLMGMAPSFGRCLILQGEGHNGKSVFLEVIGALFAVDTKCSIAPQMWQNKFYLAGIAGKRLNVVNELPEGEILAHETFKSVITGEPTTVDRKHKDPFTLIPTAGHLFSANTLPGTKDQSDGFWRRFMVLVFDRKFTEAERVRDIAKRMIREEISAIAAWVIEGAARLERQDAYTIPASSTDTKNEWQRDSDQVRQFIAERVALDPSAFTTLSEIYPSYSEWAKASGHSPLAKANFANRLKRVCVYKRDHDARGYGLRLTARHESRQWRS